MTESDNKTVLVVDDEPSLAELFTVFLESDYTVRTATSGAQALEKTDEEVDVILLDRRMPEMTGDEVLEQLNERGVDAMVGMITGVNPDGDIVDMPFDDYMTKPLSRDALLSFVEALLLRSDYDDRGKEYFSLASKKAALEHAENDESDSYRELVDRMDKIRDEINVCLDTVGLDGS